MQVLGQTILARTLSRREVQDRHGNRWQYHSRSDRHSKVACWGILFDLLLNSPVLKEHLRSGAVSFGINHKMSDFKTGRRKNLDLVVCTPAVEGGKKASRVRFGDLVERYGIILNDEERALARQFQDVSTAPVGAVRMALEAKACMTAHSRARPRLYDELNSSHLTVHGAAETAIAVGHVIVNVAPTFISPDLNRFSLRSDSPRISSHRQPKDAQSVVEKLREIPRRAGKGEEGFDALGVVVLAARNDGSAVSIESGPPAPQPDDILNYNSMISRVSDLYHSRYK